MLENINKPSDLDYYKVEELEALCAEIRKFLIQSISKTGGHLASNLGTVELTVALHKVFDSPCDKFVWDVGHQCYTHKLLTGRRDKFETLRQLNGISGFPKTNENEHDAFLSGHSSTSISAALGIAKAFDINNKKDFAVAVIGDGSLTGGQAYEALNNAGRSNTRLVVVINHNDMSISKNVGALAKYLSSIRSKSSYIKMKFRVDKILSHTPLVGETIKSWLEHSRSALKTLIYRATFFEEFGFKYLGPIDGHNIKDLLKTLELAKSFEKPVVVHVETKKGKGYSFAEENPGAFHGISKFDIETGNPDIAQGDSYSTVVGRHIKEMADVDHRICAVTAAMKYGTGLQYFSAAHKQRFFDVGIAEEHAVTFSAGLASQGLIPIFAVYSSFIQRSYDQLIHDCSIEKQHVVLAIDRAGLVGEDGETHQGIFDVAMMSHIPNMTIYSPEGYDEVNMCLTHCALKETGLCSVRYPRGNDQKCHSLEPTIDYSYVDNNSDTIIVSYGRLFSNCYRASELLSQKGKNVSLLKMTKICPIRNEIIETIKGYKNILFYEEAIKSGSIGSQIGEMLMETGYTGNYKIKAIDATFVEQGKVNDLLKMLGLDSESIADEILKMR